MGTRGFIGFVVDGTEKIAYNHWDSYPSGLGVDTLQWLRDAVADIDGLRQRVRDLRVVSRDSDPTPEDVTDLAQFYDGSVGGPSDSPTWYQLLRGTQGNPAAMLAAGVIEDASGFPADSLFAEWGYVVDLDASRFEIYKGFQREPHNKGRFHAMDLRDTSATGSTYYPAALVAAWPLSDLPADKAFCDTAEPGEDEDED